MSVSYNATWTYWGKSNNSTFVKQAIFEPGKWNCICKGMTFIWTTVYIDKLSPSISVSHRLLINVNWKTSKPKCSWKNWQWLHRSLEFKLYSQNSSSCGNLDHHRAGGSWPGWPLDLILLETLWFGKLKTVLWKQDKYLQYTDLNHSLFIITSKTVDLTHCHSNSL